MSLNMETERRGRALVVRLKGELDHHASDGVKAQMEAAIEQGGIDYLILNLKDLSFMDSSGLGVILGRYKQLSARGGKMVVCEVNAPVYRLFELSGLFKILTIADTERSALASLGVAL